jgi:hypothetical protein
MVSLTVLTISSLLMVVFLTIHASKPRIPVRLGVGFFVDGYRYIDSASSYGTWRAEEFYINNDGSFKLTLGINYATSEHPNVTGAEYLGSGFLMIVTAVYYDEMTQGVYRTRLSKLIPIIAESLDSKSSIVEYHGNYDFPNETTNLKYVEVQFSWIRVFRNNHSFYFQWMQGRISDWEGQTNEVYQDITGEFLACYPILESETNPHLLCRDFPGFNDYVGWLKENLG